MIAPYNPATVQRPFTVFHSHDFTFTSDKALDLLLDGAWSYLSENLESVMMAPGMVGDERIHVVEVTGRTAFQIARELKARHCRLALPSETIKILERFPEYQRDYKVYALGEGWRCQGGHLFMYFDNMDSTGNCGRSLHSDIFSPYESEHKPLFDPSSHTPIVVFAIGANPGGC